MKFVIDTVAKSIASESNYFRGAFLARLRKQLEANASFTSKENSIAEYQKVFE